ncbi:hypothetical protein P175DRAFT_0463369, partial [Aspergillus ochraceoroseus IBT 24754]
ELVLSLLSFPVFSPPSLSPSSFASAALSARSVQGTCGFGQLKIYPLLSFPALACVVGRPPKASRLISPVANHTTQIAPFFL